MDKELGKRNPVSLEYRLAKIQSPNTDPRTRVDGDLSRDVGSRGRVVEGG